MSFHPDWLTPQWSAPAHVHAVCTTRAGGQSSAPFDALNLGDHVGDHVSDVHANRQHLQNALGVRPVFLSQVHGTHAEWLTPATGDGLAADASVTRQSNVACTVMVADCLPVLFTNEQGTLVAAAHAGWRGLLGQGGHGVLEQVVSLFRAEALMDKGPAATKIIAWLGPCIGPTAFEVGDEVRTAFVADQPQAASLFVATVPGKWLANLPGLARQRLVAAGVGEISGNDGSAAWCTVSQASGFFSYRRDGRTGRFAACIWRD